MIGVVRGFFDKSPGLDDAVIGRLGAVVAQRTRLYAWAWRLAVAGGLGFALLVALATTTIGAAAFVLSAWPDPVVHLQVTAPRQLIQLAPSLAMLTFSAASRARSSLPSGPRAAPV